MTEIPALGYCPKCREMLIQKSGKNVCLNCEKPERPKHVRKPPPVGDRVPSEAELKRVIGDYSPTAAPKASAPKKAELVCTNATAADALEIMRNLPMPKTSQEFRQIQKIIKQLEKLVEGE